MPNHTLMPLPADARLIDLLHIGRPHVIGCYLLLGDQPALVDPGPASTLDTLEASLAAQGLALVDIQTILLTHIHLDHAGATGMLLRRYPHIQVYVHTRGAPHLIAPEKLIHSATRLYGDAMQRLWGPILLVIPARRAIRRTVLAAPSRRSRAPRASRKIGPSNRSPMARSNGWNRPSG